MNFKLTSIVCLLLGPTLSAAVLPDWMEPEYRFAVEGESNELAAVETTLRAVREAMDPKARAEFENRKSLGAAVQWCVRLDLAQQLYLSQTNVAAAARKSLGDCYCSPKAHPKTFAPSDFRLAALTNIAANVRKLPAIAMVTPVWGDGYDTEDFRVKSVRKLKPGKDYPSDLPEVVIPDSSHIEITLRGPDPFRTFRFRAVSRFGGRKLEYRWVALDNPRPWLIRTWARANTRKLEDGFADFDIWWNQNLVQRPLRVAVFARGSERELWGMPVFITITAPAGENRRYTNKNRSWSIDYGAFRDEYELDEKGRVYTLQRFTPGSVRGVDLLGKPSMRFDGGQSAQSNGVGSW